MFINKQYSHNNIITPVVFIAKACFLSFSIYKPIHSPVGLSSKLKAGEDFTSPCLRQGAGFQKLRVSKLYCPFPAFCTCSALEPVPSGAYSSYWNSQRVGRFAALFSLGTSASARSTYSFVESPIWFSFHRVLYNSPASAESSRPSQQEAHFYGTVRTSSTISQVGHRHCRRACSSFLTSKTSSLLPLAESGIFEESSFFLWVWAVSCEGSPYGLRSWRLLSLLQVLKSLLTSQLDRSLSPSAHIIQRQMCHVQTSLRMLMKTSFHSRSKGLVVVYQHARVCEVISSFLPACAIIEDTQRFHSKWRLSKLASVVSTWVHQFTSASSRHSAKKFITLELPVSRSLFKITCRLVPKECLKVTPYRKRWSQWSVTVSI